MKNGYARTLGVLAGGSIGVAILLVLVARSASSQLTWGNEDLTALAAGALWWAYRIAVVGAAALIGWLAVRAVIREQERMLATLVSRTQGTLTQGQAPTTTSVDLWEQPAQEPAD